MSEAVLGYGTKFLIHDGAGVETALASFLELAEITDGPDDDETIEEVQVTNQQSPDRTHEYITGFKDGSSISIPCNFINDASQLRMKDLFETGTKTVVLIKDPVTATAFRTEILVTGMARSRPTQAQMIITFTVRKTGAESNVAMPT